MQARLPNLAQVKSWSGGKEMPLSDMRAGDEVIGYLVAPRDLCVLRLTRVEPAEPGPIIGYFLQHYRWCYFFPYSEVYTLHGLAPVIDGAVPMSYCVVNPKRLVARPVADMMELPPAPGWLVEWEGDALLWSEGVLVGSNR